MPRFKITNTSQKKVEGGKNYFLTSRFGTKAGFGPATRPMNDILYAGGFSDYGPNGPHGFVKEGSIDELNKLDHTKVLVECPEDTPGTVLPILFATVYKALQLSTGRHVAIKLLDLSRFPSDLLANQ